MDLIKSFRSFVFTTTKIKENIHHVYIIPSLSVRRMKKTCTMYISSLHYNTKGRGKVELFISHHFIITWKKKESSSMFKSSLHYNKERRRKLAECIYHQFIITRKDEENLQHVYIITSL